MADLTVTATSVLPSASANAEYGTLGEAATAGQPVYKKAADSKFYKAQCDAATDDDVYGILLSGGAAGQPCAVQRTGDITIGATVGIGTIYVLSAAAGGICPSADLVSTNYVTIIGVGVSATDIRMALLTTSIQKA
jgi:hypothetical protein